jgi:hypothetical protein
VLANDLQRERDFYLEDARDDAKQEGRELTAEEGAGIRSEFMVLAPPLAPAPTPDLAARLRNAQADALIAAAEDARSRGDIGKEDGVEASDFLMSRAKRILDEEMFDC